MKKQHAPWLVTAAILVLALVGSGAQATHQPANKVAASASIDEAVFLEDGDTELLLEETFKTSKSMDLLLQVSAECSIVTDVITNGNEMESAGGQLTVNLTISTNGGTERPIGVTSTSPPANMPGVPGDDGGVVFCDQKYLRDIMRLGDNNNDDARFRTFLSTRSATGFNWVQLNAGSGLHTVKAYASYAEEETSTDATAEGAVGRRTLIIEPVRMKNDEHVDSLSD